jgi:hypothetical protein
VTSLALTQQGTRLLTGSLDAQVKIYDVATMGCVYSMKLPEPVMCLAVTGSGDRFAAGHPSGQLTTKMRKSAAADDDAAGGLDLYNPDEEVTAEQMLSIRAGRVGVDVEAERIHAAMPKAGTR